MSNKENDLTSSNEVDTEDDLNNISSREELSLRTWNKNRKGITHNFLFKVMKWISDQNINKN